MPAPTGYQLRYWTRYRIVPEPGTTVLGNKERVYIYQRGYTGNASEVEMDSQYLLAGGTPVRLTMEGGDERNPFEPMIRRKAKIELVTQSTFSLSNLYTDDDRLFFVVIDHCTDETADTWLNIFSGWISPFNAEEPYQKFPYKINFTATCGLDTLRNIDYRSYPDKKAMRGKNTLMLALQTALAHLGYDISIYAYLPIAEVDQLTNSAVPADPWNPLMNKWFDQDLFKEAKCYDVIQTIVETFGAQIVQQDGAYRIRSIRAMGDIKTADGSEEIISWYNWGKTLSGIGLVVDRSRPEVVTRQVYKKNELIPLRGSNISIEPQYHRAEVALDYGDPENELPNGDFAEVTGSLPNGMTRHVLTAGESYAVGDGTEDNPWGFRINGNVGNFDNGIAKLESQRVDQWYVSFPSVLIVGRTATIVGPKDKWKLSFEYVNTNCKGAKIMVRVFDTGSGKEYFLNSDGTLKRVNDKDWSYYYFHDNIYYDVDSNGHKVMKAKPTKGVKVEVELPDIPDGYDYTFLIKLYRGPSLDNQTFDPPPSVIYRNFSLSRVDQNKQALKGERYIATIPHDGPERKADDSLLKLGDQKDAKNTYATLDTSGYHKHTYYRFRTGAIRRANQTDGTEGWKVRPAVFALLTAPIASHLAWDKLRILGAHRRMFDGEVYCLERLRPFDIPQFLELLDTDGKPMRGLILSLEETNRTRICRIKAVLIPASVPAITVKGYWETPDAVLIPMQEDETASGGPRSGKLDQISAVLKGVQKQLRPPIGKAIPGQSGQPLLFPDGYVLVRQPNGTAIKVPKTKPWVPAGGG